MIAELVPPSARWWVAFGPLPIIAAIWAYEAYRRGGFLALRQFFSDDGPAGSPGTPRDSN